MVSNKKAKKQEITKINNTQETDINENGPTDDKKYNTKSTNNKQAKTITND